jgi:hypothetical protein
MHFENHCTYKHTEADVIIPELEKILSYTSNMGKNIIEQGPPDFNGFTNKDEALALLGFACIKGTVKKRISELKGEEYEPDDWDSLANAERDH